MSTAAATKISGIANPVPSTAATAASVGRPFRLALLALAFVGCATAGPARSDAEAARTVERLRAENAGQVRKVEELENQVFILTSELENRRAVAPAAVAPPVQLPEVKLARGEQVPAPDQGGGGGPASLVDEAEVEYAGAAAERGASKRPVLKLWGTGSDDGNSSGDGKDDSDTASTDGADDRGATAGRGQPRHRAALSRRPPHPSSPSANAARMITPPEVAPARPIGNLALAPATLANTTPVASPNAAPSTRPAPSARAGGPADNALYLNALNQLRTGHHDEAVAGLRAFVAAHPQHDLADNAQYWLGECFYDRKDFSTALREFRRVVEAFPDGNKVPDALLKLGLSYLAIGSTRPGREALADLVRRFPQHPTAALAQARLAELPKEVR
jgi:tol-pal system protein YbgF